MTALDQRRLEILQHALGVDRYGRGEKYRSHFVTGEGSVDHSDCMALHEAGLMTRRAGLAMADGMDLFRVTAEGVAYVAEHSPAPPKLTRSKARYQRYLDADCDLTFREFIMREGQTSTAAGEGR